MKKTLTVNISGVVFEIDEDAYLRLKDYLNSIEDKFSNKSEGVEIIADVEQRISELLSEKLSASKKVITIEDIDQIISVLGYPEDFEETGNSSRQNKSDSFSNDRKSKRIYRDIDNRIIGGVCSGIAMYFDIDPVIVRILLFLSFFAFGPLLYIVLWIVIPAAKTPSQRLEMKGEKVTIDNLEKQIKEEFQNLKDNFKNYKKKEAYRNFSDSTKDFFENSGQFIKILMIVCLSLVLCFVVFAIVTSFVSISSTIPFFSNIPEIVSDLPFKSIVNLFVDPIHSSWLFLGIILLIITPILGIVVLIIRLIFGLGWKNNFVGSMLFLLWMIGLAIIVVVAVKELNTFKAKGQLVQTHIIETKQFDTLYLNLNLKSDFYKNALLTSKNYKGDLDYEYYFDTENFAFSNEDNIVKSEDDSLSLYIMPKIKIQKTSDTLVLLTEKKKSHGKNKRDAEQNSNFIIYSWSYSENVINMEPFFTIQKDKKWRNQELEYVLYIPEKYKLVVEDIIIDKTSIITSDVEKIKLNNGGYVLRFD